MNKLYLNQIFQRSNVLYIFILFYFFPLLFFFSASVYFARRSTFFFLFFSFSFFVTASGLLMQDLYSLIYTPVSPFPPPPPHTYLQPHSPTTPSPRNPCVSVWREIKCENFVRVRRWLFSFRRLNIYYYCYCFYWHYHHYDDSYWWWWIYINYN